MRAAAVLIGGFVLTVCGAACPGPKPAVLPPADSGLTLPAAAPQSVARGNPTWIDSLIARLERAPVQNPPGAIVRYMYKGEAVYSVPSPCCDQFGYVYSASRVRICAPSGGITGRGDGRCPDFSSTATDATVIWRETREWRGR